MFLFSPRLVVVPDLLHVSACFAIRLVLPLSFFVTSCSAWFGHVEGGMVAAAARVSIAGQHSTAAESLATADCKGNNCKELVPMLLFPSRLVCSRHISRHSIGLFCYLACFTPRLLCDQLHHPALCSCTQSSRVCTSASKQQPNHDGAAAVVIYAWLGSSSHCKVDLC
jgi:hypothetical protein